MVGSLSVHEDDGLESDDASGFGGLRPVERPTLSGGGIVELVVPFAPVPEFVPRDLQPVLRTQPRGAHAQAWTPDVQAVWDQNLLAQWRSFRQTYEHAWVLGPRWQHEALVVLAEPMPELYAYVDASQALAGGGDAGWLVGDIPSRASAELLEHRARFDWLLGLDEARGCVLQSGYRRWPLGSCCGGTVRLNALGTLSLGEGGLVVEGALCDGWLLDADGVKARDHSSGTLHAVSDASAAALLLVSRGHTAVDVLPATGPEVLGPWVATVMAAADSSSRLGRSVLLVETDLAAGATTLDA